MPFFSVQLDSQVLLWVEEVCINIQELEDEFLLFEQAIRELEEFYRQTRFPNSPVPLRRSMTQLRHVFVSMENLIHDLSITSEKAMTSLETSSRSRDN